MTTHTVTVATAADEAKIYAMLSLACSGDPAVRWTWPEPGTLIDVFPRFAKAFGGVAFKEGTAHRIGSAGAALWLPPGVGPDEAALDALFQETADAQTAVDGPAISRQMESHHPTEPHWYLPLLGVDPVHQGKGLGGALLTHATALFDRDGALAYLESSNIRNVPLYERHGFEVIGRIQAGGSPIITPMLRRPRRR